MTSEYTNNFVNFFLCPLSFTPESVRWLLKKGRVIEARDALSKVARLNGRKMPDEALQLPNDEKIERLGDFRDLFMSARMVHRTLGSWIMWYVCLLACLCVSVCLFLCLLA